MPQKSKSGRSPKSLQVKVVIKLKVENCPKFEKCSAPICPLDPNWERASHLQHDRVCFYLCEVQKDNSDVIFGDRGLGELYKLIVEATQEISWRWGAIQRALIKARKSSSRMNRKLSGSNKSCEENHAEP